MHPKDNLNLRLCQFFILFVVVAFLPFRICRAQQADKENVPLPGAPKPTIPETKNFFARWVEFYRLDWSGKTASSPAPARRGLPSPLDSPPFPNADWSYGGAPVIGEPDGNTYPLMTALYPKGNLPRTKVYGWLAPGMDGSTSAQTNAPEANDVYPNRLELNQAVLYIERLPDTVQ